MNVKMVTISFTLVFRNLVCQRLLTCLYYYDDWTRGLGFYLLLQDYEEDKFTLLAIVLLFIGQRMNVIGFTHEVLIFVMFSVVCTEELYILKDFRPKG